jgi:uncharacterized hydrophobic protein (TIGR00271 family)
VTDTSTSPRNDVAHMRDSVFFEGPERGHRLSRFWILLVLASIIASAGVVADSTAAVIGAMIIAPLMTPILGTMLGVVLGDRANLVLSIAMVAAGAAAAIAIGYVIGLVVVNDVVAASNSQVAGRVNPRLIDLLAALATGVVGSVALVRRDISDTLPGVAIAISLVPPLSVVGLTAEAGAYGESAGALLLFGTNVAAILLTGIIVMAAYGVHRMVEAPTDSRRKAVNRRNAVLVVVALVVVIGIPLTISTLKISRDTALESDVRNITTAWADDREWLVLDVQSDHEGIVIRVAGPPPLPDPEGLAAALEAAGIDPADVVIELIPKTSVALVPDE